MNAVKGFIIESCFIDIVGAVGIIVIVVSVLKNFDRWFDFVIEYYNVDLDELVKVVVIIAIIVIIVIVVLFLKDFDSLIDGLVL